MLALKQKFEADEYPVFWFNPWEFEQVDDILHAFLSQLTRTSESKWDKAVETTGILAMTTVGTAMDLAARLFTGNKLNMKNIDFIAAKAEIDYKKTFELFEGKYKDKHPLEVLKDDFTTFTEKVYQAYQQKPLIIFLDDLDRCLPENALILLEAIKNLFVIKNTRVLFICGIDTHIAKQFIIKRYEGLEPSFAHSYFKKIFNFTVAVPSLTNTNFVDLLHKRYLEVLPAFGDTQLPSNFEELMTERLSYILIAAGVQSIRQVYNIQQSGLFFFLLNPAKLNDVELNFMYLGLITIKECWPDLFDKLQKEARRDAYGNVLPLLKSHGYNDVNTYYYRHLIEHIDAVCGRSTWIDDAKAQLLLEI